MTAEHSEILHGDFRISFVTGNDSLIARIRRIDGHCFRVAGNMVSATATIAVPDTQQALAKAREIIDRIVRQA